MAADTTTLTRKIVIFPCNPDGSDATKEEVDRVYKYIRDGIESQNKAMNQYISALYADAVLKFSEDKGKNELNHLYQRRSDGRKPSAYTDDIKFPKGLTTASDLVQKVMKDFGNAMKKGNSTELRF